MRLRTDTGRLRRRAAAASCSQVCLSHVAPACRSRDCRQAVRGSLAHSGSAGAARTGGVKPALCYRPLPSGHLQGLPQKHRSCFCGGACATLTPRRKSTPWCEAVGPARHGKKRAREARSTTRPALHEGHYRYRPLGARGTPDPGRAVQGILPKKLHHSCRRRASCMRAMAAKARWCESAAPPMRTEEGDVDGGGGNRPQNARRR